MINLTFPEILYLFGTFHGLFLAVMLVVRRRSFRANIFLALLIVLFSFYLFENVLYSSGYLRQLPHLFLTTLPLIFLIGPLYYSYVRSNVFFDFRLTKADLRHLLPFAFQVAILLQLYSLDASTKIRIYEATLNNQQPGEFNIYFLAYMLYIVSTCWYMVQSRHLLYRVDVVGDARARAKRMWLKRSSIVFTCYLLLNLVMSVTAMIWPPSRTFSFHANLTLQLLLIHAMGYVAFIYPDLFLPVERVPAKYQSSPLDTQTLADLKAKLTAIMEEKKPWLDSELSPDYFLDRLGVSKHHFSQLLTVGMQTTFYDLINSYRIEAAKNMLTSDQYTNAKILHIAYDCGFSNKSSFLRNFKKVTGTTPTEYRENQVPRN